jgi:dipeptidase E
MRKIVAIGGGATGRFKPTSETTLIDREIVMLAGKRKPRFLFVPTASAGCDEYCTAIYKQFSRKLGCTVDILLLVNTDPAPAAVMKRILWADIIYVGEGNTLRMLKVWRDYGVDDAIRAAMRQGTVLCGASAGSIAWFRWGNSDSLKSANQQNRLIRVKGLGLIPGLVCPHYDTEKHRRPSLKQMMKTTPGVGIALDECCALIVVGDMYRVIFSIKGRKAHRVYWKRGVFNHEEITPSQNFRPLKDLLSK